MKVAFAADQLWFDVPGGIGRYVSELARALRAEDPSVELVLTHCRFPAGTGPDAAWLTGFATAEIPGPIRTLWPQWALLGRPKLPPAFDAFDVVHATNPAGVPPVRKGQKLVVTVHDVAFERFPDRFPVQWRQLYKAGLRAAAKRADAVLVPSQATADDVVSRTSLSADRVHVTPLAASMPATPQDPHVAAAALERLGVARPFVLFVGTLEPRKHVVDLVRAYRRVANDLPHALVLAGPDGWQIETLDAELASGGDGTVVRVGRVDDEALEALYSAADAFVYPSAYEGFGLPVLEAMARGVPVITSTTPALAEVAGDAALQVEAGDGDALADTLKRLLGDPALAGDLRALGRARAAGYSWAATARATLDVYRALTGVPGPGAA